MSLRVQQLAVNCETKSSDNVFVNVVVSVQYRANPDSPYDAFYKLQNPQIQIRSYVFDGFFFLLFSLAFSLFKIQLLADPFSFSVFFFLFLSSLLFSFLVVRSSVPKMTLDKLYELKEDLAVTVQESLGDVMAGYGYQILQTLVIDIRPAPNVCAAMNEINANERLRVAAGLLFLFLVFTPPLFFLFF